MSNPYHLKIHREIAKVCGDHLDTGDMPDEDWSALVDALAQYTIDESRRSFLNGLKAHRKGPRHATTEQQQ